MNKSNEHQPDDGTAGGEQPFELLEVFYTSPNTELCNASLASPRCETVIRRLPVAYRHDPAQRAQLHTESEYLQALDHRGIPSFESLLDTGIELVVPLAPARRLNLRQLMDLVRSAETRLPLGVALQILDQVLDAVQYIHQATLKDDIPAIDISLQPEAVLIDDQGHVSLPAIRLSSPPYITSSIMGAATRRYFIYAAPEQCVAGHAPDRRAGFYTLGMLCYEILTGHPLFSAHAIGSPEGIIRRKLRLLHPLVSDVHPDLGPLDGLITALLEPVPEERQVDLDRIRRNIGTFSAGVGLCRAGEIHTYIEQLEHAVRETAPATADTAVAAQLSSVTDIAQYNAS